MQGQPMQGQSMQGQPQGGDFGQPFGQMAGQLGRQAARTVATQAVGTAIQMGAAAAVPGEFSVGQFGGVMGMISQGAGMVRGTGGAFSSFKGQKKTNLIGPIITAVLFAALWIVQYILTSKGINNWATKVLGWLTYAQGGTSKNILPMIGGFFGKGMVAMAFCSLFNGGAKSMANGAKKIFTGEAFKNLSVGSLMIGVGASMILYQFFTGYGTLTGGMTAVGGLAVALRALGGGGGLIRMFIGLLTQRKTKGEKPGAGSFWGGFAMGMSFGYTLAVPLAAIDYIWTHLIVGLGLLFIGGIVFLAMMSMNKPQRPMGPGPMQQGQMPQGPMNYQGPINQ